MRVVGHCPLRTNVPVHNNASCSPLALERQTKPQLPSVGVRASPGRTAQPCATYDPTAARPCSPVQAPYKSTAARPCSPAALQSHSCTTLPNRPCGTLHAAPMAKQALWNAACCPYGQAGPVERCMLPLWPSRPCGALHAALMAKQALWNPACTQQPHTCMHPATPHLG